MEDGALFDTEYGLEGVTFPFELWARAGESLDKQLLKALAWWQNGLLFMGGDFGTGKGRFRLDVEAIHRWDLIENEARADYAEECGLRAGQSPKSDCRGLERNVAIAFPEVDDYSWRKVPWNFRFASPLLTADPISGF